MTVLVFLDTETTGLSLDDDIWEFAAIRREQDGTERELHLFLDHSVDKCVRLPQRFLDDHRRRFHAAPDILPRLAAALRIVDFLQGRPHVVGAVPNFDTERIARLCDEQFEDWQAPWHYHLIDVENLAVGYLAAKGQAVPLPWDSDGVSSALGITVAEDERHTAMGDARWAMRLYDRVMGGAR